MADLSDWDMNFYRQRLRERAQQLKRDARLQVRTDESDLVQETLQKALETPTACQGQTVAQRLAWLFKIQDNVVIDDYREGHAEIRNVDREVVQQALDESTAEYIASLAGSEPSPVDQVLAHEKQERLAAAIRQLPEAQRDVVQRIVLEHKSPVEVAEQLGKSAGAVAGLYARGIQRVREILSSQQES